MIKRPVRVIINFLRTRSFLSVYKGHDKHTHRPQHAIDSFHFKKKTRQFKQNLSWCYILLHPLLPEKKVPIPAASNSSPSILSCSPPQNPTHHCSAGSHPYCSTSDTEVGQSDSQLSVPTLLDLPAKFETAGHSLSPP